MKGVLTYFLFFLSLSLFGQKTLTQEEKIYFAIDNFIANPSEKKLESLTITENIFWANKRQKTKEELLSIVILNCNKAYFENQFSKTNLAVTSYEKAWEIYQKNKLSNYDISEYCLKPLGNLYTIIGDYDNAENTIKQYYYLAETEQNLSQKIAAILNLSNVYQNTGRVNEAIDLLEKTIQTERLSSTQKGILLNNLGNNYVLSYKNPDLTASRIPDIFKKLESSYLRAIPLLETDTTQTETIANCYRNLSALNGQWNNFNLANQYFKKAKFYFFKTPNLSPRKIAKFKYEEALLHFQQKQLTESSRLILSVFRILIPNYTPKTAMLPARNLLYAETVIMDALDLQAQIYSIQNNPKQALEAYSLSFHLEELFSDLIVYENAKIINQLRVRKRTEKCIGLYDQLFQKEKKKNYIVAAFQLAEQSKSAVLKDYLSKNKTASRAEKLHIEQLQNWTNVILKEQQKGNTANIAKINHAIKKQNVLMLSLKNIRTNATDLKKETLKIQNLFAKLEKDKAIMIEYFSGYEKMYYFVIGNKTISLHSISNDAHYMVRIWQFLHYFEKSDAILNDVKGYNHHGKVAYDALHLPQKTNHKTLIIIPDGILSFLPFEALITQETATTNFTKMNYLLNDFNIAYNNSATFYVETTPVLNNKKTVLGIFPIFEKTTYELSFSKNELHAIKNNFQGTFFENSDATFTNFKQNATQHTILHLSTHATAGDIQTPASIRFYDQEILYSELYNLNINPDLVVLSACETGIGKLYKSEGAMSVARGFQFAGAKNLLLSLWKVNDYTTSVFMGYFYKNIKKDIPYFEANANAKRDFLKDKSVTNAKKSPYYWSAFVYYGTIEKTAGNNYVAYVLILAGCFLLFFLLKLILARKRN